MYTQSSDGTTKIWSAATEQEVFAQTANDPIQQAVNAHLSEATANDRLNRFQDAISEYKLAHELDPDNDKTLNNLAWLLATCREAQFRDSLRAVEFAKKLSSWRGTRETTGTRWA